MHIVAPVYSSELSALCFLLCFLLPCFCCCVDALQVLQSAFYPTNTYDAVEADVWALGIVLCHLFFGAHTPFW
jgi:hypothetical protein